MTNKVIDTANIDALIKAAEILEERQKEGKNQSHRQNSQPKPSLFQSKPITLINVTHEEPLETQQGACKAIHPDVKKYTLTVATSSAGDIQISTSPTLVCSTTSLSGEHKSIFDKDARKAHNQLEKHRRADLKARFERLKDYVPNMKGKRCSSLSILRGATRNVEMLARRTREYEMLEKQLGIEQHELERRRDLVIHQMKTSGLNSDKILADVALVCQQKQQETRQEEENKERSRRQTAAASSVTTTCTPGGSLIVSSYVGPTPPVVMACAGGSGADVTVSMEVSGENSRLDWGSEEGEDHSSTPEHMEDEEKMVTFGSRDNRVEKRRRRKRRRRQYSLDDANKSRLPNFRNVAENESTTTASECGEDGDFADEATDDASECGDGSCGDDLDLSPSSSSPASSLATNLRITGNAAELLVTPTRLHESGNGRTLLPASGGTPPGSSASSQRGLPVKKRRLDWGSWGQEVESEDVASPSTINSTVTQQQQSTIGMTTPNFASSPLSSTSSLLSSLTSQRLPFYNSTMPTSLSLSAISSSDSVNTHQSNGMSTSLSESCPPRRSLVKPFISTSSPNFSLSAPGSLARQPASIHKPLNQQQLMSKNGTSPKLTVAPETTINPRHISPTSIATNSTTLGSVSSAISKGLVVSSSQRSSSLLLTSSQAVNSFSHFNSVSHPTSPIVSLSNYQTSCSNQEKQTTSTARMPVLQRTLTEQQSEQSLGGSLNLPSRSAPIRYRLPPRRAGTPGPSPISTATITAAISSSSLLFNRSTSIDLPKPLSPSWMNQSMQPVYHLLDNSDGCGGGVGQQNNTPSNNGGGAVNGEVVVSVRQQSQPSHHPVQKMTNLSRSLIATRPTISLGGSFSASSHSAQDLSFWNTYKKNYSQNLSGSAPSGSLIPLSALTGNSNHHTHTSTASHRVSCTTETSSSPSSRTHLVIPIATVDPSVFLLPIQIASTASISTSSSMTNATSASVVSPDPSLETLLRGAKTVQQIQLHDRL